MEKTVLSTYIKQIQCYPLLSSEQEKKLAKKIQRGDISAKLRLINSNLRLVVNIAKKYSSDSDFLMDIIQEGNLGLISAASKFNDNYGTRFSTYAYPWITQSILRYLQNKSFAINLPYRKKEKLSQLKKAINLLTHELGRSPSLKEISMFMSIPTSKIQSILEIDYSFCSIFSDEKDFFNFGDLSQNNTSPVEADFIRLNESNEVLNLVNSLPEKEKKVICYRYSLAGVVKPKTLRQVADIMGVSAECVRQIEAKALKNLRSSVSKLPM